MKTPFFLVLVLLLGAVAQAQTFASVCTGTAAPRLEVQGADLLVNGEKRFSVLVSYFDVMRVPAAAVERDFAFLKARGVHGVRVFPLWIRGPGEPGGQTPDATLLDSDGRIRSQDRWDHFAMVLRKAGQCGFIVDVTFNREMLDAVSTLTVAEYRGDPSYTTCAGGTGAKASGLSEVACRMSGPAFSHVLFDVQNERNIGAPAMQLTMEEVRSIRDAIKRVAPDRLVMVSHGGGNVVDALDAARRASLDVVAFHEEQKSRWYEDMAAHVKELRTAGRPIYLQESARATPPNERSRGAACALNPAERNPFIAAMLEARRVGAALWTFHTDAAFRLDIQSFQNELAACAREVEFLNQVAAALRR